MKWADIIIKEEAELKEILTATRGHLSDSRFRVGSGGLKQVHQLAAARKLISRLMTRLGQLYAKR